MAKVLWVSYRVPYDKVAHAGGQIHNFYLKQIIQENNVALVSFFLKEEFQKIDLDKYGIRSKLICREPWEYSKFIVKRIFSRIIRMNGFSKYSDVVHYFFCRKALNNIVKLKKEGFFPEVIILQWTQMVSLLPQLKRLFPTSKFISIEEDVSFLAAERKINSAKSLLQKMLLKIDYYKLKRVEKKCLEMSDLTILNNHKDERLLAKNNINASVWVWTPFFNNMKRAVCPCNSKKIVYYGAMSRPENYLSAIWFLDNVFKKLAPLGFKFIVVGNRPHESLKKYNNGDSIRVVGFVDDVIPYFEDSLCLVAPLVLGAGVKIKILEAMSSGLPVLTNEIGIEGIPAENEKEYFFCKEPEDYLKIIMRLSESAEFGKMVGANARSFIERNYNFFKDAKQFNKRIKNLSGN